jgi:hypothetical protein
MSDSPKIAFGDRVRVRDTPEASAAGVAKLEGDVYGFTTPSVTSVSVIGSKNGDYALNVSFEEKKETYWFSEDQLEFVSHSAGTKITIGEKEFVRSESGEWLGDSAAPAKARPWWKFWR